MDRRHVILQREVTDCDERLQRLYRAIEDGIVEIDDILRERTRSVGSRDAAAASDCRKTDRERKYSWLIRNWRAGRNKTTNTYIIDITI